MSEIRKLRSANLWQTIFAAANDAMLLVDNRYVIRACNPRAVDLYGYPEEELVGMDLHELRAPAARSLLEAQLKEASKRGGLVFETQHLRRDGTVIPVEVSTRPIKLGPRPGWVDVIRDISVRKAAEREREELYRSEQAARAAAEQAQDRLAFLIEASALLSSSLDLETTLARVARLAVPRIADWCSIELLEEGRTLRLVEIAHVNPDKQEWARALRERYPTDINSPFGVPNVIRTGKSEYYSHVSDSLLEFAAADKDRLAVVQELGLASIMIVPLAAREGKVFGAVSFVSAESARHYGEADLALAEELARHAALAIENSRLYAEAQEAIRARDMFISVASHELKTPLTIIQGYAELLKRQVERMAANPEATSSSEEVVSLNRGQLLKRVDNVYSASERLATLVNELLDVNRMQRGALQLNLQPLDLSALLSEVISSVLTRDQLAEHPQGVRISVDCPATGVWGNWDRSRIEEVLVNLIDNAVKYSREGSTVEVSLRVEPGQEPAAAQAHLIVSDRGIGIPKEEISRIFHPFMRATNATRDHFPGLGLGLAISKEIVELHRGHIWVESEGVGKGTAFHVILPDVTSPPENEKGRA